MVDYITAKVSCHIRTGFKNNCRSQTHRLEDVLTPPSVTTDGCAPYHRFKIFSTPSILHIHSRLRGEGGGGGGGGGGGLREMCQIRTGCVS